MSDERLLWLRGKIVPEHLATVSVLSSTAQYGLNAFESIRCYWNKNDRMLYAFRMREHLERLEQSCRLLRLTMPYDILEIEGYFREVISANNYVDDLSVRLTIFGDGEGSWSSTDTPSMFIAPSLKGRTNLDDIPSFTASITSWQRINDNVLPPRAKVGANYINGRYAHLQARLDGYDVPIFLGLDGKVSEGAGACVFMVRGESLLTPTSASSLLESITRRTLIQLAAEVGLKVEERPLDRTELYLADEAFLCGSAAEISPIRSIDRHIIGTGMPGNKTKDLLRLYLAVVSGEDVRYPEWRTVVHRGV